MSQGRESTSLKAAPRDSEASPNRLSCEAWRSSCSAASIASPTEASRLARFASIVSKAPARTIASIARRLTRRRSTRRQKSNRLLNGPSALRLARMPSIAERPVPRMPPRP